MAKKIKAEPKIITLEALKKMIGLIVRIDRQISVRERHLKMLKAALTREARLRKAEHAKTDGGGWSWVCEGTGGNVARVTKHGDTLRSEIERGSDLYGEVMAICISSAGDRDERVVFDALFSETTSYRPIAGIRVAAPQQLGETKAERLLHLITNSGKTTVSFETKQKEASNVRKEK